MRLRRAWTGLKPACTQAHPLGGPWPAPPKGGSLAKSPLPVFGLYACQYRKSPHLPPRACKYRNPCTCNHAPAYKHHYTIQLPGHSEAPKERNAGQGASREQGRARWAALSFRLCPSGYGRPRNTRENRASTGEMNFPQWNPLEKENHGWNTNGLLYNPKVITTGRDDAQFIQSQPARRVRAFQNFRRPFYLRRRTIPLNW